MAGHDASERNLQVRLTVRVAPGSATLAVSTLPQIDAVEEG